MSNSKQLDPGMHSALCFFLTLLFILLANLLPGIGAVVMLFWALPVGVCVARDGIINGIAVGILAGACSFFFMDVSAVLPALTLCIAVGILSGICFRLKVPPVNLLLLVVLAGGILLPVAVLTDNYINGISWGTFIEDFRGEILASLAIYEEAGFDEVIASSGMTFAEFQAKMVSYMTKVLPSVFVIIGMGCAYCNFLFIQWRLKKTCLDKKFNFLPRFREISLPWWSLWLLVAALAAFIAGNFLDQPLYKTVALNIIICSAPVFFVGGIGFFLWFLDFLHAGKGVKIAALIACLIFTSFSIVFFPMMGVFDAAVDYRSKMIKRRKELEKDKDNRS